MARKTQEEINYWFQDHTIKSGMDLSLIEKILHLNNLDTPNNIIIHKNGLIYDDFARWYCDEVKECIYPKTYEECCNILDYDDSLGKDDAGYSVYGYMSDKLRTLQDLLVCRNAYWKIAGKELSCTGSWEPDWMDETTKYGIWTYQNAVIEGNAISANRMFVFPTEEVRYAFYENFKKEIEECKELL